MNKNEKICFHFADPDDVVDDEGVGAGVAAFALSLQIKF
jgi:hypothetical protein